jgi:hypothetical protein
MYLKPRRYTNNTTQTWATFIQRIIKHPILDTLIQNHPSAHEGEYDYTILVESYKTEDGKKNLHTAYRHTILTSMTPRQHQATTINCNMLQECCLLGTT